MLGFLEVLHEGPDLKTLKLLSNSTELKNTKKVIDDQDRARKASVLSEVAETAKAVLAANPSIPFLVYEFNAYAQNKALDGALKQVWIFFNALWALSIG